VRGFHISPVLAKLNGRRVIIEERTMFINPEAEQWVLGELINDPDCVEHIEVEDRDFYYPKHKLIFNTFRKMRDNNEPIALDTIRAKLRDKLNAKDWIGIDGCTFRSGRLAFWANQLKEASAKREIENAYRDFEKPIKDEGFDSAINRFRERVNNISTVSAISAPPKFDPDILPKAVEDLKHIKTRGLKTGFPTIDNALWGMRDFVSISGFPGTGKTALGLQWAIKWAGEGKHILYFDFENSKEELYRRILCNMGNITYQDMRENEVEMDLLQKVSDLLSTKLNIIKPSDIPGNITPQLIHSYIRYCNNDAILIVDSINKLSENYPLEHTVTKDRRMMIDSWLGRLEEIKDRFNIPVIITSEVPKPPPGKGMDASVFVPKETGRIAYTSRIMFVLERQEGAKDGNLHLVKNQFGETRMGVPIELKLFKWRIEEKEYQTMEF
jgi:replicative DNA helicase